MQNNVRSEKRAFVAAVCAIAFMLVTGIMLMWSWNAFAELLDGPRAGFKHAMALQLAIIVTASLGTISFRFANRGRHRLKI
jgi:uncharacterized membrane protein YphA (DoxX/SURF4 family)